MAYKKGQVPWNKGLKYRLESYTLSDESRKQRAEKASKQWLGVERPDKRGANSNFWRGGVSKERDRIYQSSEYRAWRKAVFSRDSYSCVECGVSGVYIEADHVKPFSTHEELRFDVSNGRTLCKTCHRKTPTYGGRMHKIIKESLKDK